MDNINTTINNNDELDALRQQLAELKERLDRTTTLNEKHLLDSIKRKMRGVHKSIYKVIAMGIIACPIWVGIGYAWNLPWYFTTFTILMLLGSATADFLINRLDVEMMGSNMAATAHRLMHMKKMRVRQEFVAIPVLIGWLTWFVWELQHAGLDPKLIMGMAVGAVVGAVIGAAIGLRIYFNLQKANDEMLRQIEELQD